MSSHYNISPELNMVFLFCEGFITPVDCFETIKQTHDDEHYQLGMVRIIDLYAAELHVELNDFRSANAWATEMYSKVVNSGPIIILSRDKGIHLLVDSIKLVSTKINLPFRAHYTLEDAITALGMSDRKQACL